MILMALDHVRDFFSNAAYSPLDLTQTTPALFFTRWITHFCAPAFILLAGTSAFLWASARGKGKKELSWFLFTRGVWLIVLELTLVRLAWFFTVDYETSLAQVIWAIGWSMIGLAGLVFLPSWAIAVFAVAMIAGHNLLDSLTLGNTPFTNAIWTVLHHSGLIELWPGHELYVLYPLIPWLGVIALGYAVGPFFLEDGPKRRRRFLRYGAALLVGFILIRLINQYGDPQPWSPQRDTLFTLLSFLNVEKYPPSLLFLLLTLGPIFLALGLPGRPVGRVTGVIMVYGRVPLFFYILHLFVIHGLAVGLALLRYGQAPWLFGTAWLVHAGYPPDYGYSLPVVYLIWLGVVAAAYPCCKWFSDLKQRRRDWWLSYL